MAFTGAMKFAGWDVLAENEFHIVADAEDVGGIAIYLSIAGNSVGVILAPAGGVDVLIGLYGTLKWRLASASLFSSNWGLTSQSLAALPEIYNCSLLQIRCFPLFHSYTAIAV
jgi:hypothetical protein